MWVQGQIPPTLVLNLKSTWIKHYTQFWSHSCPRLQIWMTAELSFATKRKMKCTPSYQTGLSNGIHSSFTAQRKLLPDQSPHTDPCAHFAFSGHFQHLNVYLPNMSQTNSVTIVIRLLMGLQWKVTKFWNKKKLKVCQQQVQHLVTQSSWWKSVMVT